MELFCKLERQIQDIIMSVTITNLFWLPKTKHWGYIEKKIYLEKHHQWFFFFFFSKARLKVFSYINFKIIVMIIFTR